MRTFLHLTFLAFVLLLTTPGARAETANVAMNGLPTANALLFNGANIYKLIDGDKNTVFHGDTFLPDAFAYTLDLGTNYPVSQINIFPRQDGCCGERLSNFRVAIYSATSSGEMGAEVWGTNLFTDGTNPGSASGGMVTIAPTNPQTGRWIEVRALDTPVPDYALQMTEMEVFADVPESQINRAIGALATANQPVYAGTDPATLINGNRFDYVHGGAVLTNGFAYTLNLGRDVDMTKIIIVPRQDGCCGGRLANYRVSIHKDEQGKPGAPVWSVDLHTDQIDIGAEPGTVELITADLDPDGEFNGRWIRVESLDDPVPSYALQIAEIEVYGTPAAGVSLLLTKNLEDVAVGTGQSATLTVAVNPINGDTNLLSFRWQKDGVDIPGATNATYITPVVLSTNSGAKYKAIISYPGLPDLLSSEAVVKANYAYHASAFSNRVLWTGAGWSIDKLVNGDRFDTFHGDVAIEPGFAYQVKLPMPVAMDSIDIYPRQDGCCGERLMNFRVSVHKDANGGIGDSVWSSDFYTDGTNPGAENGTVIHITPQLDPTGEFNGQWIEILSLDDPIADYALQMNELEVFGTLADNTPKLSILGFPTNILAAPGRSSTITIAPNLFNGDPAQLTYQWKKNGTAIAGATNAVFSTGSLQDSDSTAKFTVAMSYPGLSTIESPEAAIVFDYNYARGSTAFTSQPLWPPGLWDITMLVDGDRNGVFHGGTGIQPGFAYTIDLGSVISLDQINIYPRQDTCCGERLSNFRVSVHTDNNGTIGDAVWSADLFTDDSNPGAGLGTLVTVTKDLDPAGSFEGRWIKVEALSDPVPDYSLQMTELEAIGRVKAGLEAPVVSISSTEAGLVVSWSEGSLEQVENLGGTWTTVQGATKPYVVPKDLPHRYFRAKK